jgi:hypothetical protein
MDNIFPDLSQNFIQARSVHQKTLPVESSGNFREASSINPMVIASIVWLTPIALFLVVIASKLLYKKYKFRKGVEQLKNVANLERVLVLKSTPK